jgi:hypothetical protein
MDAFMSYECLCELCGCQLCDCRFKKNGINKYGKAKVKQSLCTPWRRLGGEEV